MKTIIRGRSARVLAASALALGTALAVGVPVAGAATTPAQKVPLTQTNRDCPGTVIGDPSTKTFGFAVVTKPASGKLVAAVALKGAVPNTTYTIRLIQILPGNADCFGVDGRLTTDSAGDGNANVQEPVLTGASQVWVDLNNPSDQSNFYTTDLVTF